MDQSGFLIGPGILNNMVSKNDVGAANGVAGLDSSGKIPSSQLPSYVDDVLEYASLSSFPETGETGKIYVAIDTSKSYRWSGSTYIELSSYDEATTSASGLMSSTDKTKLDGIATGATKVEIVDNLTTNDSSKALSAAQGYALNSKIVKIGTVVSGTNAQSLDVPSGTTVNICSMQLTAGTWIISGGHQWTTDFSDMKICSIRMGTTAIEGTTVRYNIGAGSGVVTTCIITLTTTQTINLSAYQGSGTSKTVRYVSLNAVRIA